MKHLGVSIGVAREKISVKNKTLENDYYACRSQESRKEQKRRRGDGRLATAERVTEIEKLILAGMDTESKAVRAGVSLGLFNRVLGDMQMRGEVR